MKGNYQQEPPLMKISPEEASASLAIYKAQQYSIVQAEDLQTGKTDQPAASSANHYIEEL